MQTDDTLEQRDQLLRDSFTPAETLLFWILLITCTVGFCLAEPRSYWLLGFFLIAGCLTPFVLKTHEHTHPFSVTGMWPKFWLYTFPVWFACLQFTVGLLHDPIKAVRVGESIFPALEKGSPFLPSTTGIESSWLSLLGLSAIYLIAIDLFIVPKSRVFFERLLPWLCLGSVLVCIFGFIQAAIDLDAPLFTKGTGAGDFFAFFPYDGHWAAFATLWMVANLAMALLATRYKDSPRFIDSTGPWYLTGGSLLGASAFLVEAKWPATILLLTFSAMLMLVATAFLNANKDPNRKSIVTFCGLASTFAFAAGILRIFESSPLTEANRHLRRAAYDMFMDKPLFGWGLDSFDDLLPFYGSDFLLGRNYDRPGSDLAQALAELGLIGGFFPIFILILLLIRYFRGRCDIQLTNHFLIGCGSILVMALVDAPFMSPAVHLSFFIILFSGLRWADLSRNKADEVDAPKPALVTPENQRKVPFYTKQRKDKTLS
jgi:hypothetical protein